MRHHRLAAGLRVFDARGRQPRHLDHHEVDVLGIGQAGVRHRSVRGFGNLANLTHAADFLGRHRFGAGPADDEPLVLALLIRHFDPFTRHCRDVRRDHARASAREHEDHLFGHVAGGNAKKPARPLAQHHVGPHAAPVIVKARPFGLSHQGDQRVGLDLSLVRQLLQPGRVSRRGHGPDEQFHTLSLHPITSFKTWRALKPETGHLLELFSEIEQLIFLRKASHELDAHRQAVVEAGRDRDRR